MNQATRKPVWKTDAAKESFVELTKAAGALREEQLADNVRVADRSASDKIAFSIQINESYHRQLSVAYQTAASIECQALDLHAHIAMALEGR